MMTKILPLALLFTGLLACGPRTTTSDDDDGMMMPPTDFTCPASEEITVCDLKLAGGQRQPTVGDPISLKGVVVTTPTSAVSFSMTGEPTLAGFYVQDRATSDELADRFSGIAVTYSIGSASVPPVGSIIDIEGTYAEFSRDGATPQKQVQATFISPAAGTEAVRVTELAVEDITSDYEGAIIRVTNGVATSVTISGAGGRMIFGFQLDNALIVATSEDASYFARVGEEFTSVTGVYHVGTFVYDAGIYTLSPRTSDDIQPKNPRVSSIAAVQDPQHPDRPAEKCTNAQMPMERRCPKVAFGGVVVTAVGGYVSDRLRALWIQDPSVADGRYAGIKVVYGADETEVPSVGDVIDVEGEVIEWYDGLQVQFARFSEKTGTMTPAPVVVAPADIARDGDPATNPYEGVLVQIQDVSVTQACIEDTMFRDHGQWVVADDVLMGTSFMYGYNGDLRPATECDGQQDGNCSCAAMSRPNDMRTLDDRFSSITGVMDYSFDELRLNPRSAEDLVLE